MIYKLKTIIITSKYFILFKNTSIYVLSTIINSAIPFLLIPFFTKYLSPSDYGIISIHALVMAFVTPFVGLNTNNYIGRLYYDLSKNDLAKYIGNTIIVLFLSSILVSFLILFFQNNIFKNTQLPIFGIWSTVIISIQQFFITILLTLWQIKNKPTNFGIFQIISTLINFLLTLFLFRCFSFIIISKAIMMLNKMKRNKIINRKRE